MYPLSVGDQNQIPPEPSPPFCQLGKTYLEEWTVQNKRSRQPRIRVVDSPEYSLLFRVCVTHRACCWSCCALTCARLSLSWLISAWPSSSSWSLERARSHAAWYWSCSWELHLSSCSTRAVSCCSRTSSSLTC